LTIYIKNTQPFKRRRPLTYPQWGNQQFSENRMVEIQKIEILGGKVTKICKKLESFRRIVVIFLTKIMKSIRRLKNYKVKMKRNLEPNLFDQNK
jgi:division protein CdvB (Snf7/Vps24/ESCRT-III family)